jgi:enoyl-CoA hydratase/carnithine racemase
MDEPVLLKKVEKSVGTLIMNRLERRNALSPELLVNIHLTLQEWAADDTLRAVVITGAGDKAFSSGYDILAIPTEMSPEMAEIMKETNPLELALDSVKSFPYPVIAMLNGYAFGAGLNLAVCCDIRIGADDIKAGMPPARLGLVYHPEGLRQFVEVLGMARTREVFFTARTYQGPEVLDMGLAHRLVPRTELVRVTYGYAEEIAQNAPLSLKGSKRILNMLGQSTCLSEHDLKEAETLIAEAFNSEDLKEGQTAFIEKRKATFVGH